MTDIAVPQAVPMGLPERDDVRWMQAALAVGRRNLGQTWPNPAVGALILDPLGHVAGRGWTARGGRPHAETEAMLQAGDRTRGGTIYVTLEPCSHFGRTPPCADAIVRAAPARVVVAMADPNPLVAGLGLSALQRAGIAVTLGVCAELARRDHVGHVSRIVRGRPHVQLKIAASSDGKSALAGRRPVRITGEEARMATFLLRAEADAIAIGTGTVVRDDPLLTVRMPGLAERTPLRIVFDSRLRVLPTADVIATTDAVPTLVLTHWDAAIGREAALTAAGAEVVRVPSPTGRSLDVSAALSVLGGRGLTRLLVEGGPILSAALLSAGLVDEFLLFRSPDALGPTALPAIEGAVLDDVLADGTWTVVEERQLGRDRFTRYGRT